MRKPEASQDEICFISGWRLAPSLSGIRSKPLDDSSRTGVNVDRRQRRGERWIGVDRNHFLESLDVSKGFLVSWVCEISRNACKHEPTCLRHLDGSVSWHQWRLEKLFCYSEMIWNGCGRHFMKWLMGGHTWADTIMDSYSFELFMLWSTSKDKHDRLT